MLTWDEVINDANYANEGSLKIKAHASNVGPISHNLSLLVDYNADADNFTFYDQTVFDLLNSGITLFAITGDEKYLDQARSVVSSIEKHLLLDDDRVVGFAPVAETYLLAHNREVLQDIAYLAFYDSNYEKLTRTLADGILENEINHTTDLFYDLLTPAGEPDDVEMYMSYDGAVGLESLLLAYEVTNEKKYLEQVKRTILSYWQLRDLDTNLIPSSINADDFTVEKEFMQQYGAGIFLKVLLHYYYLTDDPEIFVIMKTYHDSVIDHFWDGKTWDYRVNSDGSVLSNVIEGNYAKLDDALFLLHDLDSNEFSTSYEYAKMDYDNSFQSKIDVVNDLVIHAVSDLGEKQSMESMMQYAFVINQNVGSRLFSDTNDPEYLKSLKEFYYSVILNHKKIDLGYVYGIDAYLETATTSPLNQRASGMIANKIHLTFVPTDDVKIIWTKIGNHEITEPFITTFMDSGRFNQIDFDYENKSILLHTVYNAGEVIFADKIESVLVDGDDYSDFDSHILNTLEGKHTYHVFLK